VDIASASKTADPGSNPGHKVFRKNIAMLLCVFDLICIVCALKMKIKPSAPKIFFKYV
jgi:hypothetical protein